MLRSLQARVALRYSLLFGLLAVFIGLGVYHYLKRDAYLRLDESAKTLLDIVAPTVNHEMKEHGKAAGEKDLQEVLRTVYQPSFPEQQVAVWDGTRLAAYKNNWGRKQEDLRRVSLPNGSASFDYRDLRITSIPFYSPAGRTTYRIAVSVWRGDTQNDLRALSYGLYLVIPFTFLMAAAAGLFVARRTLAPLADMAQAMDAITSKTLTARIAVASPLDEIGRLAARFNDLLERLGKAFQQQQRFMADASHELRTPISAALTAAQVTARDPTRSAEQYREALRIVEEQMLRLRRIVEDMFLLARADTDSTRLRIEEFYLDELVLEACRAMRPLAERANIRLEVASPLPEVSISGDAGLLRQVMIILLDNARKYNRPGGTIQVSLERRESSCFLSVADTGVGIPEEAKPFLFDRFFRVDSSRSRLHEASYDHGSGAGLGLAIAKWIAEQHHGLLTLDCTSESGSTFVLRLPMRQAVASGERQPEVLRSTV